jgi:hypothetical protein
LEEENYRMQRERQQFEEEKRVMQLDREKALKEKEEVVKAMKDGI